MEWPESGFSAAIAMRLRYRFSIFHRNPNILMTKPYTSAQTFNFKKLRFAQAKKRIFSTLSV